METQTATFLTTNEVAERFRIKPQTVRRWRMRGCGPRWVRIGNPIKGRVLYRLSDVENWERQQTFSSTAEEFVETEKKAA